MLSLFVILTSLWMKILEHKTELFCFLSLAERIDDVVNFIDGDVWEAKYEQTGALNNKAEI